MMADGDFHRNVAYKVRIGDILIGKPVFDNERFSFLDFADKKLVRVNLVGNIVDRFESQGEKKYIFFKLDDGSGQIGLRVFSDDVPKFQNVEQGQTVVVIGVLRHWNNEIYVSPEIIKEQDPKYLLLRKKELENEQAQNAKPVQEKSEIVAIKDKILEKIKGSEDTGGIEVDNLIMNLRETSPDVINQEIKKMIEEGIIFEPRPGKVRYLG